MCALHKLEVELLTTNRANMVLLFPNGQLDILRESSQVKIMLIAR
jgi:hypothetical protein